MPNQRARRRGQSLMEVVAASTIIATAMVPALRMMRDSLKVSRDLETAGVMSSLCVSKLEEEMAITSAHWNTQTIAGDFSSEGHRDILFVITKSDEVADGGIKDALMAISVSVWQDKNGNASKDANEPGITYGSKISKLLGYEDKAS